MKIEDFEKSRELERMRSKLQEVINLSVIEIPINITKHKNHQIQTQKKFVEMIP